MNGLDIKQIRKKLGMTQSELAKKLGVTSRTIINWEKDATAPIINDELMKLISPQESEDSGEIGVKNTKYASDDGVVAVPVSVIEILLSQQRTIETLSKVVSDGRTNQEVKKIVG